MSFYNLCKSELADLLQKAGFERYRATQLFKCIYQKNKTGGAGLTAESFLPEKLRQYIENNLQITPVGTVDQEHLSKLDGTRKCLIGLDSPKYKVESNIFGFFVTFYFIFIIIIILLSCFNT